MTEGMNQPTTAELLDALERRFAGVRARLGQNGAHGGVHWEFPTEGGSEAVTPQALKVRLELAGLSKASFSTVFSVPLDRLHAWLAGSEAVPPWVVPSIRMYELLSSQERRVLLRGTGARGGNNRKGNAHPFARIDEL